MQLKKKVIEVVSDASGLKTALSFGNDVKLSSDINLASALAIPADYNGTIDLNGFSIKNTTADNNGETCGTSGKACAAIYVNDVNTNLTIKGEGEVSAITTEATYNIPVWVRNGTVTIEGGNYISGEDTKGNASHAVYGMNSAKIYIKNGSFEVRGNASGMSYPSVLNCQDKKEAKIILSGGKYKNFGATEAAAVAPNDYTEIELASNCTWSSTNDADGYYTVE